jgi:hypothetical protein
MDEGHTTADEPRRPGAEVPQDVGGKEIQIVLTEPPLLQLQKAKLSAALSDLSFTFNFYIKVFNGRKMPS